MSMPVSEMQCSMYTIWPRPPSLSRELPRGQQSKPRWDMESPEVILLGLRLPMPKNSC
jgi:hypothetical protein